MNLNYNQKNQLYNFFSELVEKCYWKNVNNIIFRFKKGNSEIGFYDKNNFIACYSKKSKNNKIDTIIINYMFILLILNEISKIKYPLRIGYRIMKRDNEIIVYAGEGFDVIEKVEKTYLIREKIKNIILLATQKSKKSIFYNFPKDMLKEIFKFL